jgi:hypothetical protein
MPCEEARFALHPILLASDVSTSIAGATLHDRSRRELAMELGDAIGH